MSRDLSPLFIVFLFDRVVSSTKNMLELSMKRVQTERLIGLADYYNSKTHGKKKFCFNFFCSRIISVRE